MHCNHLHLPFFSSLASLTHSQTVPQNTDNVMIGMMTCACFLLFLFLFLPVSETHTPFISFSLFFCRKMCLFSQMLELVPFHRKTAQSKGCIVI